MKKLLLLSALILGANLSTLHGSDHGSNNKKKKKGDSPFTTPSKKEQRQQKKAEKKRRKEENDISSGQNKPKSTPPGCNTHSTLFIDSCQHPLDLIIPKSGLNIEEKKSSILANPFKNVDDNAPISPSDSSEEDNLTEREETQEQALPEDSSQSSLDQSEEEIEEKAAITGSAHEEDTNHQKIEETGETAYLDNQENKGESMNDAPTLQENRNEEMPPLSFSNNQEEEKGTNEQKIEDDGETTALDSQENKGEMSDDNGKREKEEEGMKKDNTPPESGDSYSHSNAQEGYSTEDNNQVLNENKEEMPYPSFSPLKSNEIYQDEALTQLEYDFKKGLFEDAWSNIRKEPFFRNLEQKDQSLLHEMLAEAVVTLNEPIEVITLAQNTIREFNNTKEIEKLISKDKDTIQDEDDTSKEEAPQSSLSSKEASTPLWYSTYTRYAPQAVIFVTAATIGGTVYYYREPVKQRLIACKNTVFKWLSL